MDRKDFREILKGKGLRYTMEREAIVDEVLALKGHFNPEDLHTTLKKKGRKVSRASIYRMIPLLLEIGVIEQVELTDRNAHYERTTGRGHHDHMLCMSCGRVIEFYSEEMERLQEKLCQDESFEGVSHTLEIMGYCRACRKKRKGKQGNQTGRGR